MTTPTIVIPLRYCRYEIYAYDYRVKTVFPNGYYCDGFRDKDDWRNVREAESQGYTGDKAVWRSLVEHELLHSLVSQYLFDRPSRVMLTESGAEFTPLWERYEEEALSLALQRYFNTRDIDTETVPGILSRYEPGILEVIKAWDETYSPLLAHLWE